MTPPLTTPPEIAAEGFSLYSFSSDQKRHTYADVDSGGIFMTVDFERNEATIEYVHRMVQMKTGPFSWPHPNWKEIFLKQIRTAAYAIQTVDPIQL